MKRIIVQLLLLILPIILWGQVDSLLIEKRVVSMVDSSHSDNMVLIQTFEVNVPVEKVWEAYTCLLYTSPSPRDRQKSRMPSSA